VSFDLAALRTAVQCHGRVARVVIAAAQGSAPREAGAAMLVWADGQSGTIGGGALEHAATKTARAALQNESPDALTRCPLGPSLGQCCGGAVTLVTQIYDTARLAQIDPSAPVLRRIDGPQDPPLALLREMRQARGAGVAPPVRVLDGWLLEPMAHPDRALWIWGAGHVGRALVAVLSPLPDLAITWIDTGRDRFPGTVPDGVTILVAADPARALPHAPRDAHHLILTYSHALDLDLCHAALSHGFASAGLIGSATKWARFRKRLTALGHTRERIDTLTCPIGDPALGKHPQAIAVSVAAALLSPAQSTKARIGDRA
jgi:xanthine dehydrogenase accessory factor